VAIRFRRSASRHGISEQRARYVIEHCPSPAYYVGSSAEGDKALFLWTDQNGVPLEVLAIELPVGDLLVFHAMRMRRKYHKAFERMLW
jgi:hypothetical protein